MEKKYYTCQEVAEMYGVKEFTVWAWIRSGKLHAMNTGKMYRITKEDIYEFDRAANIRAQRRESK